MARTLFEGTTGEDVSMLQAVLNYHCIRPFDEVLTVDGIFGPKTTARVKAFQSHNQLDADGIVGPNTGKALMTICQFSAEYEAVLDPEEFDSGGGGVGVARDPSTVTTEYELSNGLKLALNPWEKPPAKLKYVLEFEAGFVIKNPNLPAPLTLSIGAEIGRTFTTRSPDAPYLYSGAGKVQAKFEKDYTLGPIKLDAGIQAAFEAEHEIQSPHVQLTSQLSLASGVSFTIIHERFYLFAQGEVGAVVQWTPGTVQPSAQWEGTGGFKLTF